MAIAPTSESAPAPAALSDGDRISIVERREGDPKLSRWCVRPRTPRSRLAGRASGPSTPALPAATASSCTDVWVPITRPQRWTLMIDSPLSARSARDGIVGARLSASENVRSELAQ